MKDPETKKMRQEDDTASILQEAYREVCESGESGECRCTTTQEHDQRISDALREKQLNEARERGSL
jgi:hypothetical protein